MAHGVTEVVSEHVNSLKMVNNQSINHQQAMQQQQAGSQNGRKNVGVMGSRRIFAAAFKLKVLDSYRNDIDCRGNQRATARKYGIHRRQIQKWLQCEENLRSSCAESNATTTVTSTGCCAVPIGINGGVATIPGSSINNHVDVVSKVDTTAASPSSSPASSSSSASSTNSKNPVGNCNVIGNLGIATSPGTPMATPAIAVAATTAPALNLSLARLHGDEHQLTARQGPPPHHHHHHHPSSSGAPVRHSMRLCSSPTSLQYLQHNNSTNNNNNNHQVPSSSSSSVPLRGMLVSYDKSPSEQDAPSHQRHHRRHQHQPNEILNDEPRLVRDSSFSPEKKYSYVIPRTTNYEHDDMLSTGLSRSINSDGYYQTLESYHKSSAFGRYGNSINNNVKEIGLIDSASYRDKRSTSSINETGSICEPQLHHAQATSFASSSSPLLVLHATAIKSERASPDSLATPGPCETPGSPESAASMPRSRHHHDHHHHHHQQQITNQSISRLAVSCSDACQNNSADVSCNSCTNTKNNNRSNGMTAVANTATAVAAIATTAAAAVHSNETTRPLAHVHVSVDSHAFDSRDSEKRQRERDQQREQQHHHHHHHHQYSDNIKVEYEERMRGRRVKEEILERDEVETGAVGATGPSTPPRMMMMMAMMSGEPKRETDEDTRGDEHRDATRTNAILDYQRVSLSRTPNGSSSRGSSGHASPLVRDSVGTYSSLSSPRAASSSGISTSSSCSDSEIDPLDYSSRTTRNAMSDLSRRRSFSLRFKLDVLDAFHSDVSVAGNQRATARKFGINRRQVQKWLGQESELRGEIALRGGDLRQRLGPMPEIIGESTTAVDLRTSSITVSTITGRASDADLENPSAPLYCCDIGSSSQRLGYYRNDCSAESSEITKTCNLSCCVDPLNGNSMMCYQDSISQRRSSSGYPESQGSYCYSPRDHHDNPNEGIDVTMLSSPLKRSACNLTCCYEMPSSPKRICVKTIEEKRSSPISQDQPPQDVPLCLVKPKKFFHASPMQTEPVTSTVPTPPAPHVPTAATKKDAILFKPYLDNPISKPIDETQLNLHTNHRGLSPLSAQSVIVNNNNNCQTVCNLNEDGTIVSRHDYALELSLRVPVSWRAQHGAGYGEFPERLRSAFVRYPTSPHYT